MTKTITTKYDVSEHLRTPEEMAAYLEACIEEANGDATFIAKALGDIARPKACLKWHVMQGCPEKAFTKHSLEKEALVSIQFSKL